MVSNICSLEGCTKTTHAKSLCGAHYRRSRLHGDPRLTMRPGLGISAVERLALHTNKSVGCWIWTGGGERYGKIQVAGRTVSTHVFAYETHVGPVPDGQVVRHTCDTPKCVRPDHLILGSNADNSRDMTERERQARGEQQWCAKMTADSVRELRSAYSSGLSNIPELSRRYEISTSTVGKIINLQTWKHVAKTKEN